MGLELQSWADHNVARVVDDHVETTEPLVAYGVQTFQVGSLCHVGGDKNRLVRRQVSDDLITDLLATTAEHDCGALFVETLDRGSTNAGRAASHHCHLVDEAHGGHVAAGP